MTTYLFNIVTTCEATKHEVLIQSQDAHLKHCYYVDMAKSFDVRKEEELELIRVNLIMSQAFECESE